MGGNWLRFYERRFEAITTKDTKDPKETPLDNFVSSWFIAV
jgi:hypothetical protein